jgi:hypothetical protein
MILAQSCMLSPFSVFVRRHDLFILCFIWRFISMHCSIISYGFISMSSSHMMGIIMCMRVVNIYVCCGFRYFNIAPTWWRLFQKRTCTLNVISPSVSSAIYSELRHWHSLFDIYYWKLQFINTVIIHLNQSSPPSSTGDHSRFDFSA